MPVPHQMEPAQRAPRRVLIVEDDEDSRDMLSELVTAFGHSPVAAANGSDALRRVSEACPDVALIDLGLPEVDGCELARRLRMGAHPIRLVAMTGYSDQATRASAQAAGFDDYIVKPVVPEALAALLDSTPLLG